jgi:RNA polymerase sigma-70 factor (ECF subfamily)
MTEDADLIARVLVDGDHHAFGELVKRHQSLVRGLLRKWMGDDDAQADDLAQQTFLKAHEKLAQFHGKSSLATWLCQIAYSKFLMYRRTVRPHAPLDDVPAAQLARSGDAQTALRHDLRRALKNLREEERAAVICCCLQGLTHEEASRVLGWPLGTVKTHVLRGKKALRVQLAEWAAKG